MAGNIRMRALWAALAFAMQGDGDRAGELLSMLNPIQSCRDRQRGVHRYKVEPYVACADVYSEPPHVGRGGWTWYTGSAGWMYRVTLESLLGFRVQGSNLVLNPCIPRGWPAFEIAFRHRSTRYEISVENPLGVCGGVLAIKLDGKLLRPAKPNASVSSTTVRRIKYKSSLVPRGRPRDWQTSRFGGNPPHRLSLPGIRANHRGEHAQLEHGNLLQKSRR